MIDNCQFLRSSVAHKLIRTSAAMLWKFEKNGREELEKEITDYLESADSRRATLEGRAKY